MVSYLSLIHARIPDTIIIRLSQGGCIQNSTFKRGGLFKRGLAYWLIKKSAALLEDGLVVPGKYIAKGLS